MARVCSKAADKTLHRASWLFLLFVSLGLITVQCRFDFELADESFLWYGAQRVLRGEYPLRDFQAYDPMRYYWCAFWMRIFRSDSLLTFRLSNALLASVSTILLLALLELSRSRPSLMLRLIFVCLFTAWMVPLVKAADAFALVLNIAGAYAVLQKDGFRGWFIAGLCLGVSSFVGINHFVYGSSGLFIFFVLTRRSRQNVGKILGCGVGFLIGYSPALLLMAFVHGFFMSFIDGIQQIAEAGTTNVTRGMPSLNFFIDCKGGDCVSFLGIVERSLFAITFYLLPIFFVSIVIRYRDYRHLDRFEMVVLAAAVVGLSYWHYVFSRADSVHLAISIIPLVFLVALMSAEFKGLPRYVLLMSISLLTVDVAGRLQPVFPYLRGRDKTKVLIDGSAIFVSAEKARKIAFITQAASCARDDNSFFAGPYLPGAYALTHRKSPIWEIYMIFPASRARQDNEIRGLRSGGVKVALVSDEGIDGRADLGLRNTHELVYHYVISAMPNTAVLDGAGLSLRWSDSSWCEIDLGAKQ